MCITANYTRVRECRCDYESSIRIDELRARKLLGLRARIDDLLLIGLWLEETLLSNFEKSVRTMPLITCRGLEKSGL